LKEKGLVRSASETGFGTFISRILGYLRDMVIASKFGAGAFADAFYVAFRIPNLFRNLLGEGALSASFVPVFNEYLVKDEKEAWQVAGIIFSLLILILSSITFLGIIFSPLIVRIFAPGFIYFPDKFMLTVSLTKIMFPFLFMISLAALSTGVLNSRNSFFIPAVAPVMLSLGEIFAVFMIVPLMKGSIEGLAWGVLLGGAGQFLIQVPSVVSFWDKSVGFFKITFSHPGVKRILNLMLPATLGFGVFQINAFVDTVCASYLVVGSPSALYYANRLVQLPLAIFATSVATASLPAMSKCAAKQDIKGVLGTLSSGIKMILFLMMPASVGLMILGKPIIMLLFQRGSFDAVAANLTFLALFYYSIGLVFYGGVKVFASAFYSMKDTKTPLQVAIVAMLINADLNFILMRYLGVGGLALATAISSCLNMLMLSIFLKRKSGKLDSKAISIFIFKMIAISLVIGVGCFLIMRSNINTVLQVLLGLLFSSAVLFGMGIVFKMEEAKRFLEVLKNGKRKA